MLFYMLMLSSVVVIKRVSHRRRRRRLALLWKRSILVELLGLYRQAWKRSRGSSDDRPGPNTYTYKIVPVVQFPRERWAEWKNGRMEKKSLSKMSTEVMLKRLCKNGTRHGV